MTAINQTESAVVAAGEPWLLERGERPAVVGALAIVCETVACMEAIHSAVPDSWVAMAGNADKLMDCAMVVRKQYTDAKIVLAAVNDAHAEKFTGQRKKAALDAAWAVGGYLAFPPIDHFSDPVDWDNLLQSGGVFAVSRCIEKAGKVEDEPGESEPQGFNDGYDPMDDGAGGMDASAVAEVVITCGADIKPVPVRWLWTNWLAMGKFHLLAGAPGQGKTTIAMGLAATVTTGGAWPDGAPCDAGNVLVWSGEDDYSDTLLPRLLAAGADRNRVHFIDGVRRGGLVHPFDPATDTSKLQAAIRLIGGVRLIIIDPVSTAISGDSHKNAEVRRGLQPIVDLAASIDAVLLGITHLSKAGQGGDPAQRVIGSVAFTAVARVVLVAAKVKGEDGEDRRILARGKSNLGPDDGGFEYCMQQVQACPGIEATRIAWGQEVHGTARELLTDPAGEDGLDKSAVETAADFLRDVLDGGVTPFTSVKESADEAGISLSTIRRASKSIGVIKTKGDGGKWYWKLAKMPQKRGQGDQGDQDDQP